MVTWFMGIDPVLQGFIATMFTYGVTALGAAVVLACKKVNQKFLDVMMGFSGGVMIAASYWSLLEPALSLAEELKKNAVLTVGMGFLMGGLFIILSDIFLGRQEHALLREDAWRRCVLLTTAVTLHNIPEGLAVGVAFGCAAIQGGNDYLMGAVMLAIGIGLQNFPEGTCIAMPLRREGVSRYKSFFIGQLSGIVEPIAGVCGVLFALKVQSALPMALSFSAGAMISVVALELIPESFHDNKHLAAVGLLIGFIMMMVLDVLLG
ncbi:MAG: ZIP family metal transporter [Lachnospiraceae bacterium]|nr:ZIP family metal transporter [Lachnospiraceae bacterium]